MYRVVQKNKRSRVLLVLLFVITLLVSQGISTPAFGKQKKHLPRGLETTDEILVKVKPGKDISQAMTILGGKTLPVSKRLGVQRIKLPPGTILSMALAQYAGNPNVEFAEPNYIRSASFIPSDPLINHQWQLDKVRAKQAWDISKGDPSVVIAIIDSGIDYSHPDLAAKITNPYNSVLKSSGLDQVKDDIGHGTHVAGIAAAALDNGKGIAGIGGNVNIMPVKAGNGGAFLTSDVADGIYWAVDHGARVINLSLGGYSPSLVDQTAINYALNHSVVVVAAAGNDGISDPSYPAAYTGVIGVAATDENDVDTDFSNYGDYVDVSAPGTNILSTAPTFSIPNVPANYGYSSGTSMASPAVAGLAGLVISAKPGLSQGQVTELILNNAQDVDSPGRDPFTGYGRIDAYKTLMAMNTLNLPVIGYLDSPGQGQSVSGKVAIDGWVLDGSGVVEVSVLVDGVYKGKAVYGNPRQDVFNAFPAYNNQNSGYHYDLDTTTLSTGAHRIGIRETGLNGVQTVVGERTVNIPPAMGYIDNPKSNQVVKGSYTVSGWMLDNSGVRQLDVLVDGVTLGQAIYGDDRPDVFAAFPVYNNKKSGFHFDLDSRKLTNGSHILTVREQAGNGSTKTIQTTIMVSNLPAVGCLDSPGQGQGVNGKVSIDGWVLDGSGVVEVNVLVDGVYKGKALYGNPRQDVFNAFPAYNNQTSGFHYELDTTTLSPGAHRIGIRETGLNGVQTVVAERTVNIPPAMGYIDNPKLNQVVKGSYTVSGWMLDRSGVRQLDVVVDGVTLGQAIYGDDRPDVFAVFPVYNNKKSGFHFDLDSRKLTNGSHILTVRAPAGNGSTNTIQTTIMVSNLPAVGCLDSPGQGQSVTGKAAIDGWVLDGSGVVEVDVLVDGVYKGKAVYGNPRQDVFNAFPAYNNQNSGFHYELDTTTLSPGAHRIGIRETGLNGVQTVVAERTINIPPAMGYIDNPKLNQVVKGSYTVNGWMLDRSGVRQLDVLVDGVTLGQAIYGDDRPDVFAVFPVYNNKKSGFHFDLDSRKLTNGSHILTLRAQAGNGSTNTIQTTMVVSNLPVMGYLDSPGQGQSVTGKAAIDGWVLDGSGVVEVNVLVDGVYKGKAVYGNPRQDVFNVFPAYNNQNSGYHYDLDTTTLSTGTHRLTIVEVSANGTQNTVGDRTIIVGRG